MDTTYSNSSLNASSNQNYQRASISARKWMKNLALSELILSIFAMCLGSTCTGINMETDKVACIYGTGIWVGLICICRAVFGLIALNPILRGNRILLFSYFVLCIISTIASCALVAVSGHWIKESSEHYEADQSSAHYASYVLNILLLIIGLLHTVCCAISAGIMIAYYNGCAFAVTDHQGGFINEGQQHISSAEPFSVPTNRELRIVRSNSPPPSYYETVQINK